jgi:hypothetical protein
MNSRKGGGSHDRKGGGRKRERGETVINILAKTKKGGFFRFFIIIQHYFICRPSDSTVWSQDAGIEPCEGWAQESMKIIIENSRVF